MVGKGSNSIVEEFSIDASIFRIVTALESTPYEVFVWQKKVYGMAHGFPIMYLTIL